VNPGAILDSVSLEEVDDPREYITGTPLVTSFQVSGAA
jgi:hypothetical protein